MDIQYKIIGGDGHEYGPATLEELQGWIRDGRVAGSTAVWRSDTGKWGTAESFAEFAAVLNSRPPTIVAPIPEPALAPVGFWARLAAYLVDSIILGFIIYIIWAVVTRVTGWENPVVPQPDPNMDPSAYIQLLGEYFRNMMPMLIRQFFVGKLVQASYEIYFNGKFGATPGKMAIGAQIVRLDGSPIGFQLALLRWLAARVSDLTFFIGYLFIAFRQDKRALHDLMVGTKVVYKK
jgi:uncharacterized RDD family membrane protein YckC